MPVPDEKVLQQLVAEALQRLRPADPLEFKLRQKKLEITVGRKYRGYCNQLVVRNIAALSESEIGYLKFTPLKDTGYVITEPADEGEFGAVEYVRAASGNTAAVNLRAALGEFALSFPRRGTLRLPFSLLEVTGSDGKTRKVGLLRVKEPARKRSSTRGSKASKPSGATQTPPAPTES